MEMSKNISKKILIIGIIFMCILIALIVLNSLMINFTESRTGLIDYVRYKMGIMTLATNDLYDYVIFNLNYYPTASWGGGFDADRVSTINGLSEYANSDGIITINLPGNNDIGETTDFIVYSDNKGVVTVDLSSYNNANENYNYELEGWYNIVTGEYYEWGDEATIDLNYANVFYADCYADSYNFGSDDGNLADSISTNEFVTMNLFDYNELFNLYSTTLSQSGLEDSSTVSETWSDATYFSTVPTSLLNDRKDTEISSFLFCESGVKTLTKVSNRNSWNVYSGGDNLKDVANTWKITSADYRDNILLNMLFNPESEALGVKYIGKADYLFQYGENLTGDAEKYNGYYYYDSSLNAASYNQDEERFYVYDGASTGNQGTMFLPFNYYESDIDLVKANYFFGMSLTVDFYLPSNTGENSENIINGKDMEFNFSGDDDILVFFDDMLILDMSGIHDEAIGTINFKDGTYEYYVTTGASSVHSGTFEASHGEHTITVYYLERGAGGSNLGISFLLTPTEVESTLTKDGFADDGTDEGSQIITKYNQDVTYIIDYKDEIENYIGDATIIITDTLQYKIDEDYTAVVEINGVETEVQSVYDKENLTITWEIDYLGIDTFESINNEIDVVITLTVRYLDIDYNIETVTNEVNAKIDLEDDEIETGPVYKTLYIELLERQFRLIKTDEYGNLMQGVVFEIKDEDGNLVGTYTTDEQGQLYVILEFGTYSIQEIETLYGYVLNEEVYFIVVNEDGIHKE